MTTVTASQQSATSAAIRRIAELRIKALGLNCTVDEYIERTQQVTAAKSGKFSS